MQPRSSYRLSGIASRRSSDASRRPEAGLVIVVAMENLVYCGRLRALVTLGSAPEVAMRSAPSMTRLRF